MKSDHTGGGLPSNLELEAENRLLFDRTLVKHQGILVEKVLKLAFKFNQIFRETITSQNHWQ